MGENRGKSPCFPYFQKTKRNGIGRGWGGRSVGGAGHTKRERRPSRVMGLRRRPVKPPAVAWARASTSAVTRWTGRCAREASARMAWTRPRPSSSGIQRSVSTKSMVGSRLSREGVAQLDQDRRRHRQADGDEHLAAPPEGARGARHHGQGGHGDVRVERGQQREGRLPHRPGHVLALAVHREEVPREDVHRQRADEERQQHAPHPQQASALPAVHRHVGHDEAGPEVDGQRHRQEEGRRVGVEQPGTLALKKACTDLPRNLRALYHPPEGCGKGKVNNEKRKTERGGRPPRGRGGHTPAGGGGKVLEIQISRYPDFWGGPAGPAPQRDHFSQAVSGEDWTVARAEGSRVLPSESTTTR